MRAIVPWAVGWGIGGIAFAAAFVVLDIRRTEAIPALLAALASAASFGVPTYLAALRTGSRRPIAQALIWTIGIALAGMRLAQYYLPDTALASPGDLNINTYETMRARQASFDRWGVAPEVASTWVFTSTVVIASSFGCGLLSALAGSGWSVTRLIRGVLFGLATATAIPASLVLVPLVAYFLTILLSPAVGALALPLGFASAAVGTGCAAGALIEGARTLTKPRR